MRGSTWRRVRLRTLLIVVMVVAVPLGGIRWLEQRGRYLRNEGQVRAWTGQRDRFRELAGLARSKGDRAGAGKWDELAVYADGWRRVFEHLRSGGDLGHGPPIPKDPTWSSGVH